MYTKYPSTAREQIPAQQKDILMQVKTGLDVSQKGKIINHTCKKMKKIEHLNINFIQ